MKQGIFFASSKLVNCCRCGQDFRCDSGSHKHVCPACAAPKMAEKPLLNTRLSFREGQVVGLVAQGKPNKEIAYELHLTDGTVKSYMSRIFRKMGARNRTDVAIAVLKREKEAVHV